MGSDGRRAGFPHRCRQRIEVSPASPIKALPRRAWHLRAGVQMASVSSTVSVFVAFVARGEGILKRNARHRFFEKLVPQ